jgi:hypothetical protein
MLRWTVALFFAGLAVQPALGADQPLAHRRHAVMLPAGLPRPHYHLRTTLAYDVPYPSHGRHLHRLDAYPPPEVVVAPVYIGVPYPVLIAAPWVPLYSGGYETDYWERLPYACGVYGYC